MFSLNHISPFNCQHQGQIHDSLEKNIYKQLDLLEKLSQTRKTKPRTMPQPEVQAPVAEESDKESGDSWRALPLDPMWDGPRTV